LGPLINASEVEIAVVRHAYPCHTTIFKLSPTEQRIENKTFWHKDSSLALITKRIETEVSKTKL
jgi:hypothetical protein